MLFQNLGIDLILLNNLDYPIKGQGVYSAKTTWNLPILKEGRHLDEEKRKEIRLK
jgi:hypothetical protein